MTPICHKLLYFCFAITLLSYQSKHSCAEAISPAAATTTSPESYENDSVVIGDIAEAEQWTQPEVVLYNAEKDDEIETIVAAAGALTTTNNDYITTSNGKLQRTLLQTDAEAAAIQTKQEEQQEERAQQPHHAHEFQLHHHARYHQTQQQHKHPRLLQPQHQHHPVFSEIGHEEQLLEFQSIAQNRQQHKHYQQQQKLHHNKQQQKHQHHQHHHNHKNKHQRQQQLHQQHQSRPSSDMLDYRRERAQREELPKAVVVWDYQNDDFVADDADESSNDNVAADAVVVAGQHIDHNEAIIQKEVKVSKQEDNSRNGRLPDEIQRKQQQRRQEQPYQQQPISNEGDYEHIERLQEQETYQQQKRKEVDYEGDKRLQDKELQEQHKQHQKLQQQQHYQQQQSSSERDKEPYERLHAQEEYQQQKSKEVYYEGDERLQDKEQQEHQQEHQQHHKHSKQQQHHQPPHHHQHHQRAHRLSEELQQYATLTALSSSTQQQLYATAASFPAYYDQLDLDKQLHSYSSKDYFSASPRSGRHRGRHVMPTHHTLLQPHAYPLSASVVGKVFRSLPDSEQEYSERMADPQLQRLLTVAPLVARHWPVKHEAIVEGDLILGGLMMVHSREDTITCGPIMPQGGIQALEAMLYTIDRINEARLLPNITLGAHILDDCDKDSYGLEMAVDFIKGSISNIDDAEYHCNKTQVRKVISGVVGAASSVTSIQVANLLRLFRIPQVSYFSTSPELSNKQRFEYFSRTIPSDHYQVKAMVEIVKLMSWSYISIIYEESNYGIKAFEELEELLARHNICIAIKEKLVKDSGVAEEIAYDNIVQKLLTKPRARGVIIFGSDQEVCELMKGVRRNNATKAFSFIGSDGWSARNLVSDGNEPEVEGTLSVQPQANPVKGFEEYFLSLTVENNQRNPWFVEFWEDHFQCRYPGSVSTPYNNYTNTCTTKELLSANRPDFEDQLQFVSDAVMAFAYALRDMHRDLCGGLPSLCDAMKPTKGADLLKYLRKVEFKGLSGDNFRFDGNGDGPARYNIIHFKQSNEGQYHWVKVGEYYEGELRLDMSKVQFKLLHPKPPESVCSLPCDRGQAKKYVEGESCCWHCFNCSTYQIRHPIDETQCLTCQLGTLPDASKQRCQTIPEVYLRPESAWAIGAMAFSATGILVTLFVIGVFVRHNDTPIVRASGRELSYILLAGILMCYAVTFALVLRPTNIVCCIQRFCVGFCFTVVDAALLTKTNRIARIFKAGKQSAKRPSFISPKSQLVICAFLIFVQILINGVWLVIAPSHAMYHHPTREDNMLVCDSYIDASYMIAFFYPIVLIVICTVYAVLTRKIPEAFNESKHIGFTMYTTCVIWLAFVPLYFGTANHVPLRITSMSVTISLSASVTIACLFAPKLYIILIRPERNVRQSMMPPRCGNMHRTAGTGPSSMMAAAVVTAATCAQEEKLAKHITPTSTECNNTKAKKLCEMATQTITISSIFTNLDSSTYNQIPYADQYVPNNNHPANSIVAVGGGGGVAPEHVEQHHVAQQKVVANNNKINQQQHGNPTATVAITTTTSTTTATAINGAAAVATTPLGNHIMLQQHTAQQPPQYNNSISANNECSKLQTVTTTL